MKKRMLSLLLILCMAVTLMPTAAFAAEETGGTETTANEPVEVATLQELQDALNAAADANSGDTTITLTDDITVGTGETWTSVYVDGYNGAGVVTLNGGGHTITGLNAPLFAGGFGGESGIVINDLTLVAVSLNDTGSKYAGTGFGAFICAVDSMPTISLTECHVKGGTITSTSGARVGGLIGYTAGYNKQDDGPVDTCVTLKNCSVSGLTITANGSVGGLIGHAGANPATYHTITDCTVTGCALECTESNKDWRVGDVVGTANVGQVTIDQATVDNTKDNNTRKQDTATTSAIENGLVGRAVLKGNTADSNTGILIVAGKVTAAEGTVALVISAQGNVTQYELPSDAVDAAETGDTVVLLKNVDRPWSVLTINKKITLTAAEGFSFDGQLFFKEGSEGSQVVDMTFEYEGPTTGPCITIEDAPGVVVRGCTVTSNAFIEIEGTSDFAKVYDCKFTNGGSVSIEHASDVEVSRCEFALDAQGWCIKAADAPNVKITDNEFNLVGRQQSSSVKAIYLSGSKTDNAEVSGNTCTISGTADGGLYFLDATATKRSIPSTDYITGLKVTNNKVDGSAFPGHGFFALISDVKDPTITNNQVNDCCYGIVQNTDRTHSEDHNDLSNADISGNTYTDMTKDTCITLANAALKRGNVWTDYNRVQDAVDAIQPGDTVTGDPTSASETNDVTVTLKYNDGVSADATIILIKGTPVKLPTPTRSGYTFQGWYDGSSKVDSASYTASANVILTASWSSNFSYDDHDPTYAIKVDKDIRNGEVTASRRYAERGDTVTITVTPDNGYVLETVTVTDKNGNTLKLTDKGDGKYTFTMPGSKVEIKATFMEDNSVLNFFYDVPNDAYYYEAVKWAVENGVTGGVGNNLFAPDGTCTRAQAVTFLWRAAGSPAPKSTATPFTDVPAGSYYYNAVLWAIENGITVGTSATTFSPDADCTRAQIVTFLWRAEKSPAAGSSNPFTDVASGAYYADAVLWAVKENITNGSTATTFSPDANCTRAQIVTFLYRCMK